MIMGDIQSKSSMKKSKKGSSRKRTPSVLEEAEVILFDKKSVNQSAEVKRIREESERSRREVETIRESEIEELKRKGENPFKTVIKPKYELDEII